MGTLDLMRSDLDVARERHGKVSPYVLNLLAVWLYRIGHGLRTHNVGKPLARLVAVLSVVLTGAEIDPQAEIGPGLYVDHTVGVVVGLGVRAGSHLTLYGGTVLGSHAGSSAYPHLGDRVTVYTKASVVGDVQVGDGAVIGAHALALKDVPAGAVARGTPARSF